MSGVVEPPELVLNTKIGFEDGGYQCNKCETWHSTKNGTEVNIVATKRNGSGWLVTGVYCLECGAELSVPKHGIGEMVIEGTLSYNGNGGHSSLKDSEVIRHSPMREGVVGI